MGQSLANHCLLRQPLRASASSCFFCTVYAHLWLHRIWESSEESLLQLSSRCPRTSSWLDHRLVMSTGFRSPSCRSRISASADEIPFQRDAPWNCHVLVVGVWMLSVTLSSAVCPGTVEQERIQCLEDCFCSQVVLCKDLSPSPVIVWQFVRFFLLARLLAGGKDWMLCVWYRSPSWTEQTPHKQTEVRCRIWAHREFHTWRSDSSCMK